MSAIEPVDIEPKDLTTGDKFFLSFAFVVTLVRVAGLLGAAFSLLAFSFSFAFAPEPDFSYFGHTAIFLVTYLLASITMYRISKKSYS